MAAQVVYLRAETVCRVQEDATVAARMRAPPRSSGAVKCSWKKETPSAVQVLNEANEREDSAPDDVGVVDEGGATFAEFRDGGVESECADSANETALDKLTVIKGVGRLKLASVEGEDDG